MDIETRPRKAVDLNLSPLIDVIFILLIFIVLVARFVEQNQLDVDVPDSKMGKPASLEALIIHITRDGVIVVGEQPLEEDQVEEYLKPLRAQHERVMLVADGQSALQLAVSVLSAAKAAGFKEVSLATESQMGGAVAAPGGP